MTKEGRQKIFGENVEFLGRPQTETKFAKWSASRKRLRTAELGQRTTGWELKCMILFSELFCFLSCRADRRSSGW